MTAVYHASSAPTAPCFHPLLLKTALLVSGCKTKNQPCRCREITAAIPDSRLASDPAWVRDTSRGESSAGPSVNQQGGTPGSDTVVAPHNRPPISRFRCWSLVFRPLISDAGPQMPSDLLLDCRLGQHLPRVVWQHGGAAQEGRGRAHEVGDGGWGGGSRCLARRQCTRHPPRGRKGRNLEEADGHGGSHEPEGVCDCSAFADRRNAGRWRPSFPSLSHVLVEATPTVGSERTSAAGRSSQVRECIRQRRASYLMQTARSALKELERAHEMLHRARQGAVGQTADQKTESRQCGAHEVTRPRMAAKCQDIVAGCLDWTHSSGSGEVMHLELGVRTPLSAGGCFGSFGCPRGDTQRAHLLSGRSPCYEQRRACCAAAVAGRPRTQGSAGEQSYWCIGERS